MKRVTTSLSLVFIVRKSSLNNTLCIVRGYSNHGYIYQYQKSNQRYDLQQHGMKTRPISQHPTSSQRRWYFEPIIEPNSVVDARDNDVEVDGDRDNDGFSKKQKAVIERPCSIILAEEFITLPPLGYEMSQQPKSQPRHRNKNFKSWHKAFSRIFPNMYGISYTKWSITDPDEYNPSIVVDPDSYTTMTFDQAISIMKNDFSTLQTKTSPNIVLITRGPVVSWMAQFYLESLPLAGLIMVDPIPFTDKKAYDLYYNYYYEQTSDMSDSSMATSGDASIVLQRDYKDILEDYGNHWDHWTLKIEPGSIPMMVLSTMVSNSIMKNQLLDNDDNKDAISKLMDDDDDTMFNTSTESTAHDVNNVYMWRQYAELTAQRHNTSSKPPIPVLDVDPNHIVQCSSIIHDWINDQVL